MTDPSNSTESANTSGVLASIMWPASTDNQNTEWVVGISDEGVLVFVHPDGQQNLRTDGDLEFVFLSADGTQQMSGGLAAQAKGVGEAHMVPFGSIPVGKGEEL
jgi:hypothetical protein